MVKPHLPAGCSGIRSGGSCCSSWNPRSSASPPVPPRRNPPVPPRVRRKFPVPPRDRSPLPRSPVPPRGCCTEWPGGPGTGPPGGDTRLPPGGSTTPAGSSPPGPRPPGPGPPPTGHRNAFPGHRNAFPGHRNATPGLLNPLFPVTDGSYWAYALVLLALALFSAGLVGNLALMCVVWHTWHLQSAWNCALAGLAFWDFLVLVFCLPVVVFHELTARRPLGDLSCRLVPYLEVTSLGVATFSLCALSIDRFQAATAAPPRQRPLVEPCPSILAKLAVVWLGSMLLAAPELLLWGLQQTPVAQQTHAGSLMAALRAGGGVSLLFPLISVSPPQADVCVGGPSPLLPVGVSSLVLTYQEARFWWFLGCYLALPLLFSLGCDLAVRQVLSQRPAAAKPRPPGALPAKPRPPGALPAKPRPPGAGRHRPRSTVAALGLLHAACLLPGAAWGLALAYAPAALMAALPSATVPAAALGGQLLLFGRCAAAPALLLGLSRPLGRAFCACCCCCCAAVANGNDAAVANGNGSDAASTTATLELASSPSPTSLAPSSLADATKALGTPC
ncbi:G-protein coupled receptor 37-like 1 [Menidia menidia]